MGHRVRLSLALSLRSRIIFLCPVLGKDKGEDWKVETGINN